MMRNNVGGATQYMNDTSLNPVSAPSSQTGAPGPVSVSSPEGVRGAGNASAPLFSSALGNLQRLERFGTTVIAAIDRQRQQDEDAEIVSRIAGIQRQSLEYQTQYRQDHQGQSALSAGRDYASHVDGLFDSLAREDKWKGNRRVQDALRAKKAEYGAVAFARGSIYADQQRQAWYEDQRKVAEQGFSAAVASGDGTTSQQARDNCVALWRIQNPGRDSSAYEFELENKGARGALDLMVARGDGIALNGAISRFQPYLSATELARYKGTADSLLENQIAGRMSAGDYEGAAALGRQALGGSGLQGSRSMTGYGVLAKKYESGGEGVGHVSQGLQATDGNDFGSWSFITKGGAKSSGAEFLRWCAGQGEFGSRVASTFDGIFNGNWDNIDRTDLWAKGGAARQAWKKLADENPGALERLEDAFVSRRFNAVIDKLNPQARDAIRSNPALMEMAISTINQHKSAINILNSCYDADPEAYGRKVYAMRSDPKRFAATGDPHIGERRFSRELPDFLGMLHSGGVGGGPIVTSDVSRKNIEARLNNELPGMRILKDTEGITSIEDREVAALEAVSQLPFGQRDQAQTIVTRELNFMKAQRAAGEAKAMADFCSLAASQQWSPVEIGRQIDAMASSGKYRPEFINRLRSLEQSNSREETSQQKKNALSLMASVDANLAAGGESVNYDTTDIDKAFASGDITFTQRNNIIEYARNGGARKNVTVENVQDIYRRLTGDRKAKLPPELFSQVYDRLRKVQTTGKPIDNEAISRVVSELLSPVQYDRRFWWDGEEPAYEANAKGHRVVGMTVPAYRLPAIKALMKQKGYSDAQIADEALVRQFYAAYMQQRSR